MILCSHEKYSVLDVNNRQSIFCEKDVFNDVHDINAMASLNTARKITDGIPID